MMERFLQYGISGTIQEEEGESDQLAGTTFVITGTLSLPREHFKAIILKAGGKVSDFAGKELPVGMPGAVLAGNGKINEELLRILSEK